MFLTFVNKRFCMDEPCLYDKAFAISTSPECFSLRCLVILHKASHSKDRNDFCHRCVG